MATRIIWIVLQDPVRVVTTRPVFFLSRLESSEQLPEDFEAPLLDRLEAVKASAEDCRVYVVAAENLHFSYAMPELEDDEMRGAIGLRLRKDLLFPLRDFLFAFTSEEGPGGKRVEVAGTRRATLAPVFRAVNKAGLSLQRVYMRDHFLRIALLADGKHETGAGRSLLVDDGLFLHTPDGEGQRMHRFPALPGDLPERRLRGVRQVLGSLGDPEATLRCDASLAEALADAGEKAATSMDEKTCRRIFSIFDRPDTAAKGLPWLQVQEEEAIGFQPTRAHAVALAVLLFMTWQFWSAQRSEASIEAARAAISSDSERVAKARKSMKAVEKEGKALDELDVAFGLLQNESHDNLALLDLLSESRPDDMRFTQLRLDGLRFVLRARSKTRQEIFAFVNRLERSDAIDQVKIRSMTFDEGGQVQFEVTVTRNG